MMLAQPPPTIMTPATSSTDDHSSSAADPLELDSGSSHRHSNQQQRPLMMTMKRKRTKRPPPSAAAASSSFSSGSGESTTTEEEDMAHCLILLASKPASPPQQQPTPCTPAVVDRTPPPPPPARIERYSSRKYTEAAATPDGARAGFYVYECKTCSKCFPTFQALGGHRASHKKPRVVADDADAAATATATAKQQQPATTVAAPPPTPLTMTIQPPHQLDVITALSLNTTAAVTAVSKLRVHECSICGAEFASGQALGGHMRRHRPLNAPPPDRAIAKGADNKKEAGSAGTIVNLDLDLNLPAPSDSDDEEALSLHPPVVMLGLGQFNDGNKAGLVLTASALVDCHY